MPTREELVALIDSERDQHIKFLQSLVQTPSPNPPGDTWDAVRVVQDYISQYGVETEVIEPLAGAPNLVSILTGKRSSSPDKHLVLNGHIDQFPLGDASDWKHQPYSGEIEEGYMYGRGVVDMKAGTAASILAYTYLHRLRDSLSGKCVLEVVSDEETGGKFGTKYLLEQDERRSTWAGAVVLNAEPGGVKSIRFAEKGTLRMTFTIKTPGAHGAFMHLDEGSIRIASRLIGRLLTLEDLRGADMDEKLRQYLSRDNVRKVANTIMGPGAADLMLRPTVNIGTIKGGVKVNMIPPSCVFEADIRLPIGLTAETVLAEIDSILKDFPQASYAVQKAATNPAAASSIDHEMVRLIQKNSLHVRGEEPLPICSLGATDCKHFRYNGVPAFTIGPSPDTMAATDERVKVQDFLDLVKVHTLTAWEYLGGAGAK